MLIKLDNNKYLNSDYMVNLHLHETTKRNRDHHDVWLLECTLIDTTKFELMTFNTEQEGKQKLTQIVNDVNVHTMKLKK